MPHTESVAVVSCSWKLLAYDWDVLLVPHDIGLVRNHLYTLRSSDKNEYTD